MMQKIIDDREILDFNLGNLVVEFEIDVSYLCPDVQPLASTIRIPTVLLERLREQAQDLGLSLNGYLEQLADGQLPDGGRDVDPEPLTDEQVACLDRLELEWKLVPSADADAEIAIVGAAAQSGNCNSPNVRLHFDRLLTVGYRSGKIDPTTNEINIDRQ